MRGHTTLAEYKTLFSKADFDSFFKFAFVRNPWDRVYSAFNFLIRGGQAGPLGLLDRQWAGENLARYENFDAFIKRGLARPEVLQWVHFRPQMEFLETSGCDQLELNFLGLFENLVVDLNHVSKKLALADIRILLRENWSTPATGHSYRNFYSKETIDIVGNVYGRDIDFLGYDFENSNLQLQLSTRDKLLVNHANVAADLIL
jgi:hypothetical protein